MTQNTENFCDAISMMDLTDNWEINLIKESLLNLKIAEQENVEEVLDIITDAYDENRMSKEDCEYNKIVEEARTDLKQRLIDHILLFFNPNSAQIIISPGLGF